MKAWYEMTKELNGDNVDIDIDNVDKDIDNVDVDVDVGIVFGTGISIITFSH